MEANVINDDPMKRNRPKSQRHERSLPSQALQVSEVSGIEPFYALPLLVGKQSQTHNTHTPKTDKAKNKGQTNESPLALFSERKAVPTFFVVDNKGFRIRLRVKSVRP